MPTNPDWRELSPEEAKAYAEKRREMFRTQPDWRAIAEAMSQNITLILAECSTCRCHGWTGPCGCSNRIESIAEDAQGLYQAALSTTDRATHEEGEKP